MISGINFFHKFCSTACPENIKHHVNKSKETIKERYGVENVSQIEDIKIKKREKSMENYGFPCVLQSEEVKKKIRKTNLEKYGFEYASNHPDVRIKIIDKRKINFIKDKLAIKFEALKNLYNIIPADWSDEFYSNVAKI